MIRWGCGLILLVASGFCGLAMAQDRPPGKPAIESPAMPDAPAKPPADKPQDDAESNQTDEPQDVPEAATADKPDNPAVTEDESHAPAWQSLKETDQEYDACRLALSLLATTYEELEPISDDADPDCGIARPIRVTSIIPGVTLMGDPVMRCSTARSLGMWVQEFLVPAAAALPDAPRLTGLELGSQYQCRARVGTGAEKPKLSEHAVGNAIDIAAFVFDNGETLPVEPRQDTGDIAEAFQRSAIGSACLWFSTVLSPGSNAAHDNHLHLDVIERTNGWRLCQ